MTNSNHIQPRRRTSRGVSQDTPSLSSQSCASDKSMSLRKGGTFHSPMSPLSAADPALSINDLPRRSLTSPKDIEALLLESQRRVDDIIKDFDHALSLSTDGVTKLAQQEVLPVSSAFHAHAVSNANLQEIAQRRAQRQSQLDKKSGSATITHTDHDHDSDSGIGSSISSLCEEPLDEDESSGTTNTPRPLASSSVYSPTSVTYDATHKSFSTVKEDNALDTYASDQIKKYIVDPLLKEEEFQEYHSLLADVPKRIESKKITCLRDLEKTLIFLAEFKAKSPSSYLVFCNTAIQAIHTTVNHLNDSDLRRPTDRPYTNNYFVDLVEQVRQYARIMAITRQKKADGQPLDEMDHKEDEKLRLHIEEGKPAELVRERGDGKVITIEGGRKLSADADDDDMVIDADVERSMARKRKCDIGKVEYRSCRECDAVFTRACDLTKHEKTHSRPWKCPEADCRYHEDGWPTEKERDRHVNDKHQKDAALFRCLFEPCTYSSKRESNCKQHMEKAHGWEYVRAKSKKGDKSDKIVASSSATKLVPTKVPDGTSLPTPASSVAFSPLSKPSSVMSNSPAAFTEQSFTPVSDNESDDMDALQMDHTMSGTSAFDQSIFRSNAMLEHDPLFSWDSGYTGDLLTPQDLPELLNTPGTAYTNSPSNHSLPNEFDFSFGANNDNMEWKAMQEFFPSWFPNSGMPDDTSDAMNKWNSQSDFAHAGQQELFPTNNNYAQNSYTQNVQPQDNQTANTDFTLYSNGNTTTWQTVSGPMFPDLDFANSTFNANTNGIEETIYDDVDTEMPTKTQEELMLEQYMNFDGGENHGQ